MSEYIISTTNMPEHVRETLNAWCDVSGEIVRCRDCKHCYACGSFMFCEFRRPDEPVNADGYCAWGIRKAVEQ